MIEDFDVIERFKWPFMPSKGTEEINYCEGG